MNIQYSATTHAFFAQAYGTDAYGTQAYSDCQQTGEGCVATTAATQAPNTGFLGLPPDAAMATVSGTLLVAFAVVGAAYVVAGKRKSNKHNTSE